MSHFADFQLSLKVGWGLGDLGTRTGTWDLEREDVGLRDTGAQGHGGTGARGGGDMELSEAGMHGDSRTCSRTL